MKNKPQFNVVETAIKRWYGSHMRMHGKPPKSADFKEKVRWFCKANGVEFDEKDSNHERWYRTLMTSFGSRGGVSARKKALKKEIQQSNPDLPWPNSTDLQSPKKKIGQMNLPSA